MTRVGLVFFFSQKSVIGIVTATGYLWFE